VINWLLWLVKPAPRENPEANRQGPAIGSVSVSLSQNPFVGAWRGTSNLGIYSEVVFSPDGRFSSIMQSPHGAMQNTGTYNVLDARTIQFISDMQPQIQILPGAFGQWVGRLIHTLPRETDQYEFLDPGTMVISNTVPPYPATTYHKFG
jgi:hypothetical protein